MKISVVSDLHIEWSDYTVANPGADVLILSGDIMMGSPLRDYPEGCEPSVSKYYPHAQRYRSFLKRCSQSFKHIIYVAGNHELYRGRFYGEIETLREECSKFDNIYFLENDTREIDDVVFVGATLWTDCNKQDGLTMWSLPRSMNDFAIIKNDRNDYRALTPSDTVERHKESLAYFEQTIAATDKPVVVVAHHAPSHQSIAAKYKKDWELNGAFASELSEFILKHPQIKLWTHGHTHTFFDYVIGETRVVCNPRGYNDGYNSETTGWNPDLVIQI